MKCISSYFIAIWFLGSFSILNLSGKLYKNRKTIFLLEHGYIREVPDHHTAIVLSFNVGPIEDASDTFLHGLQRKEKIKSFPHAHNSRKHHTTDRFNSSLANFDTDSPFLISCRNLELTLYNPSVVLWNGKRVICTRFLAEPYDYDFTKDVIGCSLYDSKSFNKNSIALLHQNSLFPSLFTYLPPVRPSTLDQLSKLSNSGNLSDNIFGEDPRIIVSGAGSGDNRSTLTVVFNHINETLWPTRRMGFVEVQLVRNGTSREELFVVTSPVNLITLTDVMKYHQKNWSPFLYKNAVLYVYSIDPHRVLCAYPAHSYPQDANQRLRDRQASDEARNRTSGDVRSSGDYRAETVSLTALSTFRWNFGEMRGGTPAILVPCTLSREHCHVPELYLSFFHSKRRVRGRRMTYFMGAYTFFPYPPFRIHSVTVEPVLSKSFYQGKLAPNPFDYIVYPTSFLLLQEEGRGRGGGTIVELYLGRQDQETWVARLDLVGLLRSMRLVDTVVLGDSDWRNSSFTTQCQEVVNLGSFTVS